MPMIIRCYNRFFAICILTVLCSCNRNKTLLLKNATKSYDSLFVLVKVNDKTEISGYENRSNVSLSYREKKVNIDGDSVCVDVNLPTLGISKRSCAVSAQGNIIVITINEVFSQTLFDSVMKINPTNQDKKLYRAPQVSIAFLKQKLEEVH